MGFLLAWELIFTLGAEIMKRLFFTGVSVFVVFITAAFGAGTYDGGSGTAGITD